jgi:hypothetical protein
VDNNSFHDIVSYYRLKQTDYDGNSTYSPLVSVSPTVSSNLEFIFFKADQEGNIVYMFDHNLTNATIDIIDLQGKIAHTSIVSTNNGMILSPGLKGGIYLARLTSGQEATTKKFVYFSK